METHPIQHGYIPDNAKTLIIGTFPPRSEYYSNSNFFFYSSTRSHLWNRMENIFPEYQLKKTATKLTNISSSQNKIDKQNFCCNKKVGFLDIFTKIERKKKNSTRDTDIIPKENIVENGILFKALDKHCSISRICCSYKLAYDILLCRLDKSQLKYGQNQLTANGEEYVLHYNSRNIKILLLYPATRSSQKGKIKDEQYISLIFNHI